MPGDAGFAIRLGQPRPCLGDARGGALYREARIEQVATHDLAGLGLVVLRPLAPAGLEGLEAARREDAALGRRVQVRHVAGNGRQDAGLLQHPRRIALQQRPGVGMPGPVEDLAHVAPLHHLAGIHDDHLVAQLGDQAEIVGDHHHGRLEGLLQLAQQVDDLGFHGDVESGGRLVGDQQRRVHHERHGDAGALAHAAAELVRELVHPLFRVGDADPAHNVDRDAPLLGGAAAGAAVLDVGHLPAIGQYRDLRGHGVLEDHRDLLAAIAAQVVLAEAKHVLPFEQDAAALDHGVAGQQPGRRPDHRALARAAFADDAEDLLLRHADVDVAQRMDPPARRLEVDAEVADLEQVGHALSAPCAAAGRRRRAAPRRGR